MSNLFQSNQKHNHSLLFLHSPEDILIAHSINEVRDVINTIEKHSNEGNFIVACFSYEIGETFGLTVKQKSSSQMPLIWAGVYSPHNVTFLQEEFLTAHIPEHHNSNCLHTKQPLAISEDEYIHSVEKIKEFIAAGDTYQVNFTTKTKIENGISPLQFFCRLMKTHPVPYAAYINTDDWQIVSISPELFLQKKGKTIESKPMKGTMRRGMLLGDDIKNAEKLQSNEKDRAENLMILDMVRNDLSRVCEIGSINVPLMFTIEKYRSLFQMTSTICGTLKDDVSLLDIFAATFPASSITGAPKFRTMEIINELEKSPRGIYTGSIGLFSPKGDFTLNVAIRTLVHKNGSYELGVGSGIVWDSDPKKEYAEVLLKSNFAAKPLPIFEIFETLILDTSRKYRFLQEHIERIAQSATYWDYPFDREQALNMLNEARLTVKKLPEIVRISLAEDGNIKVSTREYIPQITPVIMRLSHHKTHSNNRFLRHKTSNRLLYNSELEKARNEEIYEVLFMNENNRITEGSFTNIFLKKGEEWFTPPIEDGLLPGIWRSHFIADHNVIQQSIPINSLDNFDEVIIGNSVRDIIYIQKIINSEGIVLWGSR